MIRYLIIPILTLTTLTACIPALNNRTTSEPAAYTEPDIALFIEGIDHFDTSRRSDAFLQLEQKYPDSDWNRRAKVLASLAGSIRLLEKQINRQQALLDGQQGDHLALIDLRQENELLREQVNVLKSLIVDLELRQP